MMLNYLESFIMLYEYARSDLLEIDEKDERAYYKNLK